MNNIEIALEETMYEMIFSDIPKTNYKIRRSFDRRMKKMIRSYLADNTLDKSVHKSKKRWRYIIIIAVTLVFTITAAAVVCYNNIALEKHDTFSLLHIEDTEKAPENIEQEYVITAGIDGYMRNTFYNNDGCIVEEYKDGDSQIIFSQMTFSHFNGTRINTETAEGAITAVDVNGITALYFENGMENMLVWNNDEYVFSFQTNKLGKDELIALSESVKPKQ